MRADNSEALRQAAKQRRQATYDRARAALRQLEASGEPVTFDIVAREGAVSRAWLYAQPEIRDAIERLRAATHRSPRSPNVPAQQRASDASLIRRLETAHTRNKQLSDEIRQLREELARAHGDLRVLRRTTGTAVNSVQSRAGSQG